MKKTFLLFAVVLLFAGLPALADQTQPAVPSFDMGTVEMIQAGALGLTVVGVTEMLKRALKAKGALPYVLSFLVSAAATAYFLVTTHQFGIVPMIGYTVAVFLVSNGIFKAAHTPTPPPAT